MDKGVLTTLQYINLLQNATLENSGLSEDAIYCLQNPRSRALPNFNEDLGLRLSLQMYYGLDSLPQRAYSNSRKAILNTMPDIHVLTYTEVDALVRRTAGVFPIFTDMCPTKSCVAFTGHFESLDHCPECGADRWEDPKATKKTALKQALTLPVGPAIQAFYAGEQTAVAMDYRRQKTHVEGVFDDIFSGDWYQGASRDGCIRDSDTLLMFSIDGAQLYQHKNSDCWSYIWVIMDMDPKKRYKKQYVLPGGIIPGPEKPKVLDSFLFPGLYHIAALQRDPKNLRIFDASQNEERSTRPIVILATADTPGMSQVSGSAGHTAAKGCRKACGLPGRHQAGIPTYYPMLNLPDSYSIQGCDHPDIDLGSWSSDSSQTRYSNAVMALKHARPGNEYERGRKKSGFSRPSIFSGIPCVPFGVPDLFPLDGMHLFTLNIPELFISLWRGATPKIRCYPGDDKASWDWAVLKENIWLEHGKRVDLLRPYLPSSYEQPPRNPVTKINSGYKASEYLTYFYGYLPCLLAGVLPDIYLENFYKLVRVIRLFSQSPDQVCAELLG